MHNYLESEPHIFKLSAELQINARESRTIRSLFAVSIRTKDSGTKTTRVVRDCHRLKVTIDLKKKKLMAFKKSRVVACCFFTLWSLLLLLFYFNTYFIYTYDKGGMTLVHSLDNHGVPHKSNRNIFFLETSCVAISTDKVKAHGMRLDQRQACTIESAARANPGSHVYFLHTCPIDAASMVDTNAAVRQIFTYSNVRVINVDPVEFVAGTVLEGWFNSGKLLKSLFPVVHASHVFRFLTLWKFGGLYLDMDYLIMSMKNNDSINSAVLHLSPGGVGHELAQELLEELAATYVPNQRDSNGPQLLTKVLLRRCGVNKVTEMTPDKCGGFLSLHKSSFSPVSGKEWTWYFDEKMADKVMKLVNGSHGVHLWSSKSYKRVLPVGSHVAYGLLAEIFCPRVYSKVRDIF
uniref:Alpha 1,4-glycosyltransferase domain-containing protein n=1 Tax=Timema tahoe TaxID=61484 RepID=A0A7R9IAZ7_9NEOP|nr:unnamed protein product [Timema tahoe]